MRIACSALLASSDHKQQSRCYPHQISRGRGRNYRLPSPSWASFHPLRTAIGRRLEDGSHAQASATQVLKAGSWAARTEPTCRVQAACDKGLDFHQYTHGMQREFGQGWPRLGFFQQRVHGRCKHKGRAPTARASQACTGATLAGEGTTCAKPSLANSRSAWPASTASYVSSSKVPRLG
jgi:hypothetical protein